MIQVKKTVDGNWRAAEILREPVAAVAAMMAMEQGKPVAPVAAFTPWHFRINLRDLPGRKLFGGVKDSGCRSKGGCEAIEPYLVSKFAAQAGVLRYAADFPVKRGP